MIAHFTKHCSMSNSCEVEIESIKLADYLDLEMEDWRSKMIKVVGNQHPYTFYVTAGHDFEDIILKVDVDAAREFQKLKPFENLKKMSEIDSETEKDFHKLLSEMEKEKPTLELKAVLEEKKNECSKVLEIFDKIVSVCEDYFQQEYSDCHNRVSKQIAYQQPVINEVENFLSEVEEFGNAEIKSLRDRISKWIYDRGLSMLNNIDKSYNLLSNQPFAMKTWFDCSAELTSKEVRRAFLADQKEMCNLWKKAFNDLLILSAKLEKCRCNYNLMKFKLEREIFLMNRDYKENMPELTKIQRHLTNLIDEKVALKLEMKNLESEVKKEQKRIIDTQNKMNKKIISTKANNKFAYQSAYKKFQSVLSTKKEEIYNCLSEVLKGDQFIHEEILGVPWSPVDLSHLKTDDIIEHKNNKLEKDFKKKNSLTITEKKSNAIDEDDFSQAFKILISSENFINLLNMISEKLGYILDFTWVNYVKERLELTQEIRWIELFKVFKINFEELKELKEHMISYCKLADDKETVFDINGAIDGFLNFAWKKRQSPSHPVLPSIECDPKEHKNYWSLATSLIPKSLLWENVEEVLIKYWELLETRSNLLKIKFTLLAENQEFDNYLENYHRYGTLNI